MVIGAIIPGSAMTQFFILWFPGVSCRLRFSQALSVFLRYIIQPSHLTTIPRTRISNLSDPKNAWKRYLNRKCLGKEPIHFCHLFADLYILVMLHHILITDTVTSFTLHKDTPTMQHVLELFLNCAFNSLFSHSIKSAVE